MRIGYFGDGPWAHESLERLVNLRGVQVVFLCTRFDTPDQALIKIAIHHGITVYTQRNVNSEEFLKILRDQQCDLCVSMSFDQILKPEFINVPIQGVINCHAGKLPFYRGRNVLNWVLINDENEFGITLHYVDSGIDTGDIIVQKTFPITDEDDYSSLLQKAYLGCADVLIEGVTQIRDKSVMRMPQRTIHPEGFYCSLRRMGDEVINWDVMTSRDIFNFVRALCAPGPMAKTFCRSSEVRVGRAAIVPNAPVYKGIPGAVLAKSDSALIVKTLDSYIKLTDWTSEVKITVGDRFK